MSKENVGKFITRLNQDEAFRQQFQSFKTREEAAEFVKKNGYEFTQDEFKAYQESEELTDEQLSNVAGGASYCLCLRGDCGWQQCLIEYTQW